MRIDDDHYLRMQIQPRELYAAVPGFRAYPMLVAIKYVSRALHKGQAKRDIEQAINCLNWVLDDPVDMPYLVRNEQWSLYLSQFSGRQHTILEAIGLHKWNYAIWEARLLLDELAGEPEPSGGVWQVIKRHLRK